MFSKLKKYINKVRIKLGSVITPRDNYEGLKNNPIESFDSDYLDSDILTSSISKKEQEYIDWISEKLIEDIYDDNFIKHELDSHAETIESPINKRVNIENLTPKESIEEVFKQAFPDGFPTPNKTTSTTEDRVVAVCDNIWEDLTEPMQQSVNLGALQIVGAVFEMFLSGYAIEEIVATLIELSEDIEGAEYILEDLLRQVRGGI